MTAGWLTYRQHGPNGVLPGDDERAAIPEGQSVGHVHYGVGEAYGHVYCDGFLHSKVLSIHQVLVVSVQESHICYNGSPEDIVIILIFYLPI